MMLRPAVLWEWLWRGKALAQARAEAASQRATARPRLRALAAAQLAESAFDSADAAVRAEASALSAGLFAQSIAWSLSRASSSEGAEPDAVDVATLPPDAAALARLLDQHQALVLDACAGDPNAVERLQKRLLGRSFEDLATPATELKLASSELGSVARRLLRGRELGSSAQALLTQRLWRVSGLVVLPLLSVTGIFQGLEWLEQRADLTRGKPWRASSVLYQACLSPQRDCALRATYLFHTFEEASPWLELDLGQAQRFRSVRVYNRRDCCTERAVPLVIEVSDDRRSWREIARKSEPFLLWRAEVAPTTARWVRLRVTRPSILHLFDLRILP